jgi:predicted Rossmann fold nucleotide-binding protein DprA/Smf involved in DNA uptake
MVNCPRCGKEAKPTGKEWDYSRFHVKYFNCPYDNRSFKAYYHDGKLSHTIPKRMTNKERVVAYLKEHKNGTQEELVRTLNLQEEEVMAILTELEQEGQIYSSPDS